MKQDIISVFRDIIKLFRKNRLAQLSVLIVLAVHLTALLVFIIERQSNSQQFGTFGDALWWSVVTIGTVGYGDKVPVTAAGRIVGAITIASGMILVSLFTATISSLFVARKIKESQGLQDINFTDHILICGWNPHVEEVLKILSRYSPRHDSLKIVLVNESQPELMEVVVEQYPDLSLQFVHGDYSREPILNRANIKEARSALFVPQMAGKNELPSDEKTLLAVLTAKSLNPKIKVHAHIMNRDNIQHLKRANADDVVVSDQFVGFFLANQILYPGASAVATELLDYEHGNDIHRVEIPTAFVGKTYGELLMHFKKEHNWTLIGLVAEEEQVSLGDILSSDMSAIDTFIERKFKEAGINVSERMGTRVQVNPHLDITIHKKDFAVIIGTVEPRK